MIPISWTYPTGSSPGVPCRWLFWWEAPTSSTLSGWIIVEAA